MKDFYKPETDQEMLGTETFDKQEALCRDLIELIRSTVDELTAIGFSSQMARFDCLHTVKLIVDGMYDEIDVGQAQQDWYGEYVRLGVKDR